MKNFAKDPVLMLKQLQKIITDNLKYSETNVHDDADVAEVVIELTDKKRKKLLKKLSKAMDAFVKEFSQEEKLKKNESKFYSEQRKVAVNEHEHFNEV